MLHTLMRWLLASILLSGSLIISPLANVAPGERHWVPGQILVAPRVGVGPADFDAALQRHGGRSKGRIEALGVHIVSVPEHAEEAVASALAHNPRIRFAELDMLVKPDITSANDTYYSNGWHLATINAPVAWDSSRGGGIVVAVLDSGVDASHPDLQGQLVPGRNMYDNNANTADVYGHGTKVAGVIAALSNNGMGVTSIAWDVKIMPVRISGTDGWASSSTIASGLSWAADNGAQIANISYAISGSSTVTSAASYMRSKGGVVFASAGNDGNQSSIAPNASIITVSATKSGDTLAGWSTYGDFVDIAAPGAGIWSTKNGGDYGSVSGTSFSSPAAAAVGALIMASNPSLTPDQVDNILKGSSVDLGTPGNDAFFGYGRIDAAAASGLLDNCILVTNLDQLDTDGDGYGNLCDGDLNNDGDTNTLDLNLYKLAHRSEGGNANYNVDADFNSDGVINTLDQNSYKGLHRKPPGPSCCGSFRPAGQTHV